MHITINNKYLNYNNYKVKCAIGKRGIGNKKKEGDLIIFEIEDIDGDGNLDVDEDVDGDNRLDFAEDVDGDGNLQVEQPSPVAPDGATGWHTVRIVVD